MICLLTNTSVAEISVNKLNIGLRGRYDGLSNFIGFRICHRLGLLVKCDSIVLRPAGGTSRGNDRAQSHMTHVSRFHFIDLFIAGNVCGQRGGGDGASRPTPDSLRPSRAHQSPAAVQPTPAGRSLVRDGQNDIRPASGSCKSASRRCRKRRVVRLSYVSQLRLVQRRR